MKKNIIIAILSVVSLFSMTFAIYQKTIADNLRMMAESAALEAKKQEVIARENAIEAIRQKELAEQQRDLAEMNAAEAIKQQKIAIEQSQLAIKNAEIAKSQAIKPKH